MGEIADALRRAREDGVAAPKRRTAEEREPVYARAADREAPSGDAPEAAQVEASAPADATLETPKRCDVEIPRDRRGAWAARAVIAEGDDPRAESYRHFAIRLARELEARHIKSVMVVSALRHEGKTTTACNLALAYASMAGGRTTALVDLDLRRPNVARALGIEPRAGLESLLAGDADLDDVRLRTDLAALDVYPTAHPLLEPHRELAEPRVGAVLRELERRYDIIVIDTAPLMLVPDTELLFPHVGGAVAVARSRRTKREAFRTMVATIPAGKLLGTFMNDSRPTRHAKNYGYYGPDARSGKPPRGAK